MKTKIQILIMFYASIVICSPTGKYMWSNRSQVWFSPRFAIQNMQYADIAGIGDVKDYDEQSISIENTTYWYGNYPTNEFTVDVGDSFFRKREANNKDDNFQDDPPFTNRKIVFFLTTNEWKQSSMGMTYLDWERYKKEQINIGNYTYYLGLDYNSLFDDMIGDLFVWGMAHSFTNAGPACAPKIADTGVPTVFILQTNYTHQVSFYSNLTETIFISKDKERFYEILRDEFKNGMTVTNLQTRQLAGLPLLDMVEFGPESDLVKILNDPLMEHSFRKWALWELISRFGWPRNSTVPVP